MTRERALARSQDPPRDYIQEAGRIARGETRMIPELEHVRALVDEVAGLLLEFRAADITAQDILTRYGRGDYYHQDRQQRACILLDRLEMGGPPRCPECSDRLVDRLHRGKPTYCDTCDREVRDE